MKIGRPSMEAILHVHMHLDLPLIDNIVENQTLLLVFGPNH
jgi:hypothetical protein